MILADPAQQGTVHRVVVGRTEMFHSLRFLRCAAWSVTGDSELMKLAVFPSAYKSVIYINIAIPSMVLL